MRSLKKTILFTAALTAFILGGCKKTNVCNGVPNVGVNFTVDVNSAGYAPIQYTGGSMLVSGGNAGVAIYRYQTDQFEAYDCLCPNDGSTNGKAVISILGNKIQAECPVCHSIFSLADGSVSSGPSTCALKAYKTYWDGTSQLTVTN
jgi:nitrite reductase/ring-hydroxylating ferredoxin subunit